jgi:BirA family biotin operon repressor/biotin-[acetyl-CoA-carboxylase] ligase
LKEESLVELQKLYESNLYRLNKVSTFKLPDSNLISGYINGVNDDGRLKIILENDVEKSYGIKEISLIN